MTESLLRRVRPRIAVSPAQRRDLKAAQELCAADPVGCVLLAMHIESALAAGRLRSGRLWVVKDRDQRGELVALVWAGANLMPVVPTRDDDVMATVAGTVASRIERPSAIVGHADVVLDLWGRLEPAWRTARQVRASQWLMAIDHAPRAQAPLDRDFAAAHALESVRLARMDDYDALLPACVDMFRGEVGYDPLEFGRDAYEERLKWLVRSGRSLVQYGEIDGVRQVVYKAEAGIVGGGVAELQGVWVAPELRGHGLARAGLSATVERVRATIAPSVSLYVNDFNAPAARAYEAVGFARVGTFATVMM